MLPAMEPRLAAALMSIALVLPAAALVGGLPPGFVYLRDVAPGIVQDMRYAGANNFTGDPLPGYDAAECVLKREAAFHGGQHITCAFRAIALLPPARHHTRA